MKSTADDEESALFAAPTAPHNTVLAILFALSFSHLLNDTMQSLLPAIYPLLKTSFDLSFTQVGLITLTNQLTASLLQPLVGLYTDRYPKPYSLAVGMGFTLAGLVLLGLATHFAVILAAAALVGMGSSVFHPEASRVARMASGGRHGFAQSLFQVGGNAGTSFGPLLAALIIMPGGRKEVLWFSLVALAGIVVLTKVGHWYRENAFRLKPSAKIDAGGSPLRSRKVFSALAILVALVFSKYFYLTSMTSYYTFFLTEKFHFSAESTAPITFSSSSSSPSRRERSSAARWEIASDESASSGPRSSAWLPSPCSCPTPISSRPGFSPSSSASFSPPPFPPSSCLCAGTGARQGRHDRRIIFRPRLRHGRHRLGRARETGRCDEHHVRVRGLLVSAPDRNPDLVPARCGKEVDVGSIGLIRRMRLMGRSPSPNSPRSYECRYVFRRFSRYS